MIRINVRCNHGLHLCAFLFVCYWSAGCQVVRDTPSSVQITQTSGMSAIKTVTPVPELTVSEIPLATTTLESVDPLPSITASEPTAIPTETLLPTTVPVPWEMALSDTFLIHNAVLDGLFAIYLLQPEGVSYLLSEGWLIDGQSLSPDGTKLVFDPDGSMLSVVDRPNQLVLFDLTTGHTTLMQLLARPRQIFWSADSRSFFYPDIVGPEGQEEFHIVSYNIENRRNETVVNLAKPSDERWSWQGLSYSGRYQAFIIKKGEQYDVYTFDMETSTLQQVTNTPEVEVETVWSLSADQLLVRVNHEDERSAFAHPPFMAHTLLVVAANGDNLTTLGNEYEVTSVGWSSDGAQIAYINAGALCIRDMASETEHCPLQNTAFQDQHTEEPSSTLAWSSDNQWLAFYAYSLQYLRQK